MSIGGHLHEAEEAFQAALAVFSAGGHARGLAWAKFNYATFLLSGPDPERGMQLLEEAVEEAKSQGLRFFALSRYAVELAKRGELERAVQVAEEVFAERLKFNDPTSHAEGFVDFGRVYHMAGRQESARPLIREGIRRLRETGIQDLLLDTLIVYADSGLITDEAEHRDVLKEAQSIANRIGSSRLQLELARVRMKCEFRHGNSERILETVEDTFRLTQALDSRFERERSLKILADELSALGKPAYADAVRVALGQTVEGPVHAGWKALLSTDSPQTICVLASVLAKEALDA
jgi:tetratricopeptide (TPR) repeat protein